MLDEVLHELHRCGPSRPVMIGQRQFTVPGAVIIPADEPWEADFRKCFYARRNQQAGSQPLAFATGGQSGQALNGAHTVFRDPPALRADANRFLNPANQTPG